VGSAVRHDRIERWVDAVVTPNSQPTNPMNFAALLMGLPLPAGLDDGDDGDPFGYLDIDQNDPDLEDLREEFRPPLKERFDGWNDTALLIHGGPALLLDIYAKLMDLMPFLRATDAIDEMISRIADKPSKHHICDALDALSTFCKAQRKKTLQRDKKLKTEAYDMAATAGRPQPGSTSPFPNRPVGFAFAPSPSRMGGMEDVD